MAVIPELFRRTGEGAIASYPYNDIADGTGTIKFYGFTTNDSSNAIQYKLGTNAVYSATIESSGSYITQNVFSVIKTLNFDNTAFNFPKTIKGTAIVSMSSYLLSHASSTVHGYLDVSVIRLRGATETTIGNASGAIYTTISTLESFNLIPIPLTTTTFKRGDILRLKVVPMARYSSGDTEGLMFVSHDPQNRDGTKITAINTAEFYIPFKIEN